MQARIMNGQGTSIIGAFRDVIAKQVCGQEARVWGKGGKGELCRWMG